MSSTANLASKIRPTPARTADRRLVKAAAAMAVLAISPLAAHAATKAFSTAPNNGNFSGINFTIATTPAATPTDAFISGDSLYFGTSAITALNNDLTGAIVAGITFNTGASAFTIGGNDLSLSAAITNNSTALQTINNNLTLTAATAIAGTGSVTLGGTIGGAFALNKTTAGTLTLNGANSTFSGGTTLGASNGATVIRANATQALGTGTIGILGNATTNRLELANNSTLSNTIVLSGRTTQATQAAIESVSGNNTLSGLISFTSGGSFYNLQSDAGTLALTNTGTVTFQDVSRVLTFQGAGNGSFASTLAGLGSVAKTGSGTWTLSANNTYTGATTVSGGTLTVTGTLGTGALTVSNANTGAGTVGNAVVLNLPTATATTVGALIGTIASPATGTNTATINLGAQTLTVNQAASVTTYAGTLAGAGGLTVGGSGTGSLTLNGSNTYTGATTVNGGTLAFGNTGNIASSTGLTVASGAGVRLSSSGINTVNVGGPLTLTSSTLSFDVGNAAADRLTVAGAASINGTNTINLTGLTGISAGNYTLISATGGLGSGFVLGSTPSIFGSFSLAGSTATAEVLTVTANPAANTEYWTGKASTTLGDTAPYKWSTGSTVGTVSNWSTDAAGTVDALQVPLSNTLAVFTATNATPTSGTTLATQLVQGYAIRGLQFDTSTNANGINAVTVDTNGQTLSTGTAGLTLAAANTSDVTISGTGSLVVNGSQNWANNSAKTLTVSTPVAGNASSGTNTLSFVGSGAGNVALGGVISDGTAGGTQALVVNKTGGGSLTLSAANTYSGGTTLTSGSLVLGAAGTTGSATGALTVNGGTLDLGGATKTVGVFSGTGGTIVGNSAANPTFTVGNGGTVDTTYAGVIANTNNGSTGSLNFTKTGTGTLTLTGANTFGGNVSVAGNGALRVASLNSVVGGTASSSLGAPTSVAAGTINLSGSGGSGTLIYVGAGETTDRVVNLAGGTAGANSIVLDQSGTGLLRFTSNLGATGGLQHTLTLRGSTSGVGQIDGAIVNNSAQNYNSVTKSGNGTWTLNGSNTYTGTTTVTGGTLALGTAAQTIVLTGTVTAGVGGADIQNGAIDFDYSGTSPASTIRGLLATGYGIGFTAGNLRSSTATANRGLGYLDTGATVIVKSALFGDADLDGGVSINDFNALAGNFGQSTGKVWVDGDFDYDGGVSINDFNLLAGNFGQTLPASAESFAGLLAFAAAHNDLAAFEAVTGVPEPTTLGLLAAGLTLGLRRRRHAAC